MGEMALGRGSEFHLLRYLGYHRQALDRALAGEAGGRIVEWLDFGIASNEKHHYLDLEYKGLDFLEAGHPARFAWEEFWPQTGNVQNWDAVGRLRSGSQDEYLLVEAKAHVEEIKSNCGASEKGGRGLIRKAFNETTKAYSFDSPVEKWLKGYYQYANRLATLHFLLKNNVSARLLFIYFLGDQWPEGKNSKGKPINCPKNQQEWEPHLGEMYKQLGLKKESELEKRVHRLFLHVGGPK